jgi:predicted phosphodiesterase
MRIAALYDIHSNLPALDAALTDVRAIGVDATVIGGDVVPGPLPRATIAALLDLRVPVRFIQGNGERDTIAMRIGTDVAEPAGASSGDRSLRR